MSTKFRMTLGVTRAAIPAVIAIAMASAWGTGCRAEDTEPDADEKMVVVRIPAAEGGDHAAVQAVPPAISGLLNDGWHITQATSLGKSPDGSEFVIALVLDRPVPANALPAEGGQSAIPDPGSADPVKPAPVGELHVVWDDGNRSKLEIGAPSGVRNPVTVTTNDADGSLVVSYPATAFVDERGVLHVDARGEPLSGPQAEAYSPDSFAIAGDGTVTTLDDQGHANKARLDPSPPEAETPVAPSHPQQKPMKRGEHHL